MKKTEALYFTASWCGPCKFFKPIATSMFEEADLDYMIVDVDHNVELSGVWGVMSLPTVVLLTNDEEYDRIVGPDSKKLEKSVQRLVREG